MGHGIFHRKLIPYRTNCMIFHDCFPCFYWLNHPWLFVFSCFSRYFIVLPLPKSPAADTPGRHIQDNNGRVRMSSNTGGWEKFHAPCRGHLTAAASLLVIQKSNLRRDRNWDHPILKVCGFVLDSSCFDILGPAIGYRRNMETWRSWEDHMQTYVEIFDLFHVGYLLWVPRKLAWVVAPQLGWWFLNAPMGWDCFESSTVSIVSKLDDRWPESAEERVALVLL